MPVERERPAEIAAGYLAAISLAASAIAIVYRPVRLAPFAILVALVAAAMAGRGSRLPALAVAFATLAWLVGMTIAVLTSRPIY
jgi:predicted membrane protein